MRILCICSLYLLLTSCDYQAFPEEKFRIDNLFRELIKPYHPGDTLVFKSSKNEIDSILITKIDSAINNRKGYFINARNSKHISVRYRQFPIDHWSHSRIEMGANNSEKKEITEDASLLDILRFPDTESTILYFNFRIFLGCGLSDLKPMHHDTLSVNGTLFKNCYKIDYCEDRDDHDLATTLVSVYSTVADGIVAYQYADGTWWVRIN